MKKRLQGNSNFFTSEIKFHLVLVFALFTYLRSERKKKYGESAFYYTFLLNGNGCDRVSVKERGREGEREKERGKRDRERNRVRIVKWEDLES